MFEINETHDPNLKSWVESANDPKTDFPIQNLPYCHYRLKPEDGYYHGAVIGDQVIDLSELFALETIPRELHVEIGEWITSAASMVSIAESDTRQVSLLRRNLIRVLSYGIDAETRQKVTKCLIPLRDVLLEPAFWIGDYTDFYCSIFHATNVGSMFRPDNPLLPNYKYVPIGYHGRASSIVISGTDITRPHGQNRSDSERPPVFIPCRNLDYEMELGFFVGQGNELGRSIPIGEAEDHIFGVCLVNDWSARDIQAWEYQPLGPFLAKNFATTISPYVVTMEALAPFRTTAFERDSNDPQPLDYLSSDNNQRFGGLDINLEVYIQSEKMRNENIEPHLLSRSNTKDLYWTIGQMLTHHASNGCNLQTGDLMATGTVSGKEKNERGCLLELTWRGTEPLELPSGEQRRFLEDGDEVIMRGYCEREGFRRIGLGECRGRILPAR
ncbi:MAG TPA: fumarylacetoacetase [Pyrinomonadaceae bacterium]|nr:fumarylacetoacetase [Pyrinomonadaceae bacterium]